MGWNKLATTAYVDAQVDTVDTLTEVLAIGNRTAADQKIELRDAAIYINSSTDGQLDIVADTEIQIAATTIDINGAVALNGAISGATNITLSGELDAATLDISGNADIDGTTNLDAVDIDGAVQLDATFTVGADDQGYDVKLFGDTASAYVLWDTSADKLLTAGGATIDIVKDKLLIGGTAVTTTAAELNILDGVTADKDEINLLEGITTLSGSNTGDVSLAGSYDYLTLSSQAITLTQIDLTTDVTGLLPDANLSANTAHLDTTQTFSGAKTFSANVAMSANLEVAGNLDVRGTTTTIDSANLAVTDPHIMLNVLADQSDYTTGDSAIIFGHPTNSSGGKIVNVAATGFKFTSLHADDDPNGGTLVGEGSVTAGSLRDCYMNIVVLDEQGGLPTVINGGIYFDGADIWIGTD